MPLNLNRQAFGCRVAVAGHVCEEGSERAVNADGGFMHDGGRDAADGDAEGGEEAVGFHLGKSRPRPVETSLSSRQSTESISRSLSR